MNIKQLKELKSKGLHPFRFADCLSKLEKFMFENPDMDFEVMARQLNRTLSSIERVYDRLQAKRNIYDNKH